MQSMLQQFAWAEDRRGPQLELRNQLLAALGQHTARTEPLFCFETSIKLFYFAALIYEFEEVSWETNSLGSHYIQAVALQLGKLC